MSHREPTRSIVYASSLKAQPKAVPAPTVARIRKEKPSVLTKLGRAKRSLMAWKEKGFPMVTREERNRRMSICRACPYWNERGNFYLGQCSAPGCGCTKAKMALATERCPLTPPKWDRVLT